MATSLKNMSQSPLMTDLGMNLDQGVQDALAEEKKRKALMGQSSQSPIAQSLGLAPMTMTTADSSMNLNDTRQVLAGTAWGEARGLGRTGMQGVINVVQNRVAMQDWMGKTLLEVCLKPYQFSCWNSNDPNRAKILAVTSADPDFAVALGLADRAIAGTLPDLTYGADNYYDTSIGAPKWVVGARFKALIGDMLFWRV